jgi:GWxTD domain-containing protein
MDMNSDMPAISGSLNIVVPNRAGVVDFSDLLIAEEAKPSTADSPLNKSGYEIIPRLSNFYGPEDMAIPYYVELYNSHMFGDSLVGVMQRVIDANGKEVPGFTKVSRIKTSPVVSYIRSMDIQALPSGSYKLELSLIDKATMLPIPTNTTYFFDRINEIEMTVDIENIILDPNFQASITDDSLGYYLASLLPIAKMTETKNILSILKAKDKDAARKHIQQFWVVSSGTRAYDAWIEYKKNVQLVQKLYGTNFQDGFETDRGRVYLQYGPPNQITARESSPSEYPYEIWQYDAIKVYHNKRFVFYNPDLVNNNYRLLHSDMVGELQNRMWQQALVKRNTPDGNIDDPNISGRHGENSGLYYKQF